MCARDRPMFPEDPMNKWVALLGLSMARKNSCTGENNAYLQGIKLL